jgi:glycerophosphoryl diester phosphodiesterase
VPILIHDDTLDRTTDGRGHVSAHALGELRDLDAGSWFDPRFSREPIPTLDDALSLLEPTSARIFAELKGPASAGLVEGTADRLVRTGVTDRAVVISMDWEALERIRTGWPDLVVGFIAERADRMDAAFDHAASRKGDLVDPNHRLLRDRPDLAERARRAGVPMAVWTVDQVADARDMERLGVEALTTNQVSRILDLVGP